MVNLANYILFIQSRTCHFTEENSGQEHPSKVKEPLPFRGYFLLITAPPAASRALQHFWSARGALS